MPISRARRLVRALRDAGVDVRCQVDVEGNYELSTPREVKVPRELDIELARHAGEVARYLIEERTAAMWASVVDAILQSILATRGGWRAGAAYDCGPDAVARGYVRGVVEQPDLAESLSTWASRWVPVAVGAPDTYWSGVSWVVDTYCPSEDN